MHVLLFKVQLMTAPHHEKPKPPGISNRFESPPKLLQIKAATATATTTTQKKKQNKKNQNKTRSEQIKIGL